jgi:hypothetical protein
MRNRLSNINKTNELIENLKKAGQKNNIVYAYAFGMAWSRLSDEARANILKSAEKMANEKS